jgi:hypothetical protein
MSVSNLYSPEPDDARRLKRYRDGNDEPMQQQTHISSSTTTTPGSSQPSSSPETRKIAGTNRVTAATQSNNAQASASAPALIGMTLPHPFSTDIPPHTNFNIDPIFSLPLHSNELGNLPLHESFDPFGDAQTFANSADMWMNELFAEESLTATNINSVIPGPGPETEQFEYSNPHWNEMLNQMYSQHMVASLYSDKAGKFGLTSTITHWSFRNKLTLLVGPSTQTLAPEQTGQPMFADWPAEATSNIPMNMSKYVSSLQFSLTCSSELDRSNDWDSYISNMDELLCAFMAR